MTHSRTAQSRTAQKKQSQAETPEQPEITGFRLALANFEGPFDLLLQLIHSKKMDITDIALHEVTDEFLAYTRFLDASAGLDERTEFLVVAATLLDAHKAGWLHRSCRPG